MEVASRCPEGGVECIHRVHLDLVVTGGPVHKGQGIKPSGGIDYQLCDW